MLCRFWNIATPSASAIPTSDACAWARDCALGPKGAKREAPHLILLRHHGVHHVLSAPNCLQQLAFFGPRALGQRACHRDQHGPQRPARPDSHAQNGANTRKVRYAYRSAHQLASRQGAAPASAPHARAAGSAPAAGLGRPGRGTPAMQPLLNRGCLRLSPRGPRRPSGTCGACNSVRAGWRCRTLTPPPPFAASRSRSTLHSSRRHRCVVSADHAAAPAEARAGARRST
jgi:hypothetical protein